MTFGERFHYLEVGLNSEDTLLLLAFSYISAHEINKRTNGAVDLLSMRKDELTLKLSQIKQTRGCGSGNWIQAPL